MFQIITFNMLGFPLGNGVPVSRLPGDENEQEVQGGDEEAASAVEGNYTTFENKLCM